ncbi:hypothetical protein TcWFU_002602 [Taenia crassiceps]|uniref:Uncharacterized protein n=1 Tax=Taenia crassiceps TaxID=6207 RepID=A0ABR4QDS1_9CEST
MLLIGLNLCAFPIFLDNFAAVDPRYYSDEQRVLSVRVGGGVREGCQLVWKSMGQPFWLGSCRPVQL